MKPILEKVLLNELLHQCSDWRQSIGIGQDRDTRILKSHCDLCKEELPKEADNIQNRINVLDEIDESFESEYDKHEPRLLLCSYCTKEYKIPSYFIPL